MSDYITIKIKKKNLQELRLIHAATGEQLIEIVNRLVSPEADERLRELEQARQAERIAKFPTGK